MIARPMRKRMYKTMQGRMVDIEKLRASNESVRAIGNMNVNARGDVLSTSGEIVKPKEAIMREYYEKPHGKVSDAPTQKVTRQPIPRAEVIQSETITPKRTTTRKRTPTKSTSTSAKKKGIDAALEGIE